VPKNQEIRIMRNLPLNNEQVERLQLQKQGHRRALTMLHDGLFCY
jgi:hypothetical protein